MKQFVGGFAALAVVTQNTVEDSYSPERFAARWIMKEIARGKLDELELAKFLKLFKESPDA